MKLSNAANPFLQSARISKRSRSNINLLILFRPVLALATNHLAASFHRLDPGRDRIALQRAVNRGYWNFLSVMSGLIALLMIAGYFFAVHVNVEW